MDTHGMRVEQPARRHRHREPSPVSHVEPHSTLPRHTIVCHRVAEGILFPLHLQDGVFQLRPVGQDSQESYTLVVATQPEPLAGPNPVDNLMMETNGPEGLPQEGPVSIDVVEEEVITMNNEANM